MKSIFLFYFFYIFCFTLNAQNTTLEAIDVADLNLKIGGLSDEILYYGFSKGDIVVLNFSEEKGKSLKEIEVIEYPNTSKYKDFEAKEIKDKKIQINNTGIYKFVFSNSAIAGRVCNIKIQRIPKEDSTKNFNTTIKWRVISDTTWKTKQERYLEKTEYIAKQVQTTQEFWVNSGSNATFKGGKSRVCLPVTLPANTVEWYYQFSASRDENAIAKTKASFSLVSDLTKLIDKTGLINFGIDALTQPPGSDYCDIYLLNSVESISFEAKTAYTYFPMGTRENYKSGLVRINASNLNSGTWRIGIKNPDSYYGIAVAIEVVAIVKVDTYATRELKIPSVNSWKQPYLDN